MAGKLDFSGKQWSEPGLSIRLDPMYLKCPFCQIRVVGARALHGHGRKL